MKRLLRVSLWLAVAAALTLAGCDGFLDVNDDPNNPTEAPVSSLIASATYETAQNHFRVAQNTSYFVQYLASPNPANTTDTQQPVSYDDTWLALYDVLTDLTDVEDIAGAQEGNSEALGIAKLLKAINLGLLADNWGSAPYSRAFLGQEALQPEYDSGEALYEEIFALIDEGIAILEEGNFTTTIGGDEDFIYGGETERWIETGYFLRARYLNHLSETGQYDPQAVLDALDEAYESTEADAQVSYFEEQFNPWASVAIDNANLVLGGWLSEQIVGYLNGDTFGFVDPRIDFYTSLPADADEYIGTRNGAGRGDAPEQGVRATLTTDTYYASETSPVLVATYFEQKFIEAEAALRAGETSRAYEAYLDAINAQMSKVGVADEEIETYLSNEDVGVGEGALTLDDIFQEKYVAMFLHPESWVDARRHDYDYVGMEIPANLNPNLNGNFIRRLAYPDSETDRNGANVPDVSLGENVFWDQ